MADAAFFTKEVKEQIRKSYRRGKKRINIKNRMFNIESYFRKVKYSTGGETHTRNEKWLRVTPVNGQTPMCVIEYENGGNLRSVLGK